MQEICFDGVESKVQHHVYSAFGKLLKVEDANGNDVTDAPVLDPFFTFTGREYDKETGLYYFRARLYDPALGRFLTADPHPGEMINPMTVTNKYIYAGNNPTNYVDPTGDFLVSMVIGGLIGMAINEVFDLRYSAFEALLIGATAGYFSGTWVKDIVGASWSYGAGLKLGVTIGASLAGGMFGASLAAFSIALLTKDWDDFKSHDWLAIGMGSGLGAGIGEAYFSKELKKAVWGRIYSLKKPIKYIKKYPVDLVPPVVHILDELINKK